MFWTQVHCQIYALQIFSDLWLVSLVLILTVSSVENPLFSMKPNLLVIL